MGNLLNKGEKRAVVYCTDEKFEEIFYNNDAKITDEQRAQEISVNPNDTRLSVAERLSEVDEECKSVILEWKKEQYLLKAKLLQCNVDNFQNNLHFVAGVDISFPSVKDDLVHACACVVVLSFPELHIVFKRCKIVHLTSMYIPEYLAFREVEPLKELVEEINQTASQFFPQLLLVDGNGMLHPRCFGLACHLGVVLDVPTIGVAKKLFHIDGLLKDQNFKNKIKTLECRGSSLDLIGTNGFLYGKAVRSTDNSSNPIYVSIGHKISLETAVKIVVACCKVRVPEPVRWADILSREYIRDQYVSHEEMCVHYQQLNDRLKTLSYLIS